MSRAPLHREGIRDIRAVSFDAAGTLITPAAPVGETYARIARDYGGNLDPRDLNRAFRHHFPAMPPLAFKARTAVKLKELERSWWKTLAFRVCEDAGGVPDFAHYFDQLYDHYAEPTAWHVYPDVLPVLEALLERAVPMVVLSNFDSRLPPLLDHLGLAPYFEAVIYSSRAGAAKPDSRVFHQAAQAFDLAPPRILHLGDSRRADYEGAVAAGLRGLLLRRGERVVSLPHEVPDLNGVLPLFNAPLPRGDL